LLCAGCIQSRLYDDSRHHRVSGNADSAVQPFVGYRRCLAQSTLALSVQEIARMSADTTASSILQSVPKGISLWEDALQRLRKNKLAMFGLLFLVLIMLLCILAPWITPYGYEQQNLRLG